MISDTRLDKLYQSVHAQAALAVATQRSIVRELGLSPDSTGPTKKNEPQLIEALHRATVTGHLLWNHGDWPNSEYPFYNTKVGQAEVRLRMKNGDTQVRLLIITEECIALELDSTPHLLDSMNQLYKAVGNQYSSTPRTTPAVQLPHQQDDVPTPTDDENSQTRVIRKLLDKLDWST